MTQYYANGKTYTFDIISAENTRYGTILWSKCRENGKMAWLDANGIRFEGEGRFEARKLAESCLPAGYRIWGGQIRDALPHGARYYMRGR